MTSASAALELAALVAAMRDDWDSNEVSRALASAHSAGWSFGHAAIVLIGLAVTEGTEPAELTSGRSRRKGASLAKVNRATDELVVLVCKMRDDWPEAAVRREIATCYGSGWSDTQVPLEAVRLAVIADSEPRDLSAAALSPYARRTLADRRG